MKRPDRKAPSARRSWDVVIAGAGPAGLSAALVLGRACRRVLLCDTGTPRSWASKAMHGFLTRDGIAPDEFRRLAREELTRYAGIVFCAREVLSAQRQADGTFEVRIAGRSPVRTRKILIATGVFDQLPPIEGLEQLFGSGVYQCPYCDGWEVRGQPVAVFGQRQRGVEMARALTAWTRDIVLCTHGPSGLSPVHRRDLARNAITIIEEPIARLEEEDGRLKQIVFRSGRTLPRAALFFDTPSRPQSQLAKSVGCQFLRHGGIRCGAYEATSVPGVFVAGNIIKDVQLAIVAAAEGTRAGFGINRALTREDFTRRATGTRRVEHPPLEEPDMANRRGTADQVVVR